jgi:hypothetical protein
VLPLQISISADMRLFQAKVVAMIMMSKDLTEGPLAIGFAS